MGDIEAASGISVFSVCVCVCCKGVLEEEKNSAFPLQIKAVKIYHLFLGMGVPRADRFVGQVS